MILADGRLYPSSEHSHILDTLEETICHTRMNETLDTETVIQALDRLGQCVAAGEFDALIGSLGLGKAAEDMMSSVELLRQGYLEKKVMTELGRDFFVPTRQEATFGLRGIETRAMPLGTLFHIAAGNMDFLPAYTVAEGLLTGNVNLLKLPQADSGVTVLALQKLIELEPKLRHFIYVFDTPSDDLVTMKRLAEMADGIVVWGGEAAVTAVRSLAPVGAKLIEWGHRLSFAYLSGDWQSKPDELTALAGHIVRTEQLLCSSCQTIYLDTEEMEDIRNFCRVFLPYLEAARRKSPLDDIGAAAEMTLQHYSAELESFLTGKRAERQTICRGFQCSLTACEDSELVLSDLFGRVPVKRLPYDRMLPVLRRQKGYLQTAGLLCDEADRARLTDRLIRSGVNRVTSVGGMSDVFVGESHDGEYSLRRYVRMVNVEEC